MEHSQQSIEKITGRFFSAEPLLEEAREMASANFSDLDDGKDKTKLLISAFVAMVFLFVVTAAGTIWFISKNIADKNDNNGFYTSQSEEVKSDRVSVSMLDLE